MPVVCTMLTTCPSGLRCGNPACKNYCVSPRPTPRSPQASLKIASAVSAGGSNTPQCLSTSAGGGAGGGAGAGAGAAANRSSPASTEMSATSTETSSTNAEAGSRKRQKRAKAASPRVAPSNPLSEAVASLQALLPRFGALGAMASAPRSLTDTANNAAYHVVLAHEFLGRSTDMASATDFRGTTQGFKQCYLAIGDALTRISFDCATSAAAVRADQAVTCLETAHTMMMDVVKAAGLRGGGDDDNDGDDGDEAFDKETDNDDDDDEGEGSDGAAVAAAVTPARSSGAFRRLQFGAVPRDDVPMAQLATPELPRDCNNDDDMSMQSVSEGSGDGTSSTGTAALEEEEGEREDMATSAAHSTIGTVLEAWQFVTWFAHTKLHPWNEFMQDGSTKPAHKLVPSSPRRAAQLPLTVFTHHCVSP